MKNIIHLALRTGYTFKNVFGHIDEVLEFGKQEKTIGVSDLGNTFAHPIAEKKCENLGIKLIYSVRLTVVEDASEKVKPRGQFGAEYIFIAKNNSGLREIYNLVRIYSNNFYYRGNISLKDVFRLSKDVIVIAENFEDDQRIDYIALTTTTPKMLQTWKGIPKVAIVNNFYPKILDHEVYDIFTRPMNNCNQTYPQHILSTFEWREMYSDNPEVESAIENTHKIAKQCKVKLEKAPMVKYNGESSVSFLCKAGARKKKIDLKDPIYKERFESEIALIKEKDFEDYFLIVADMINKAKKKMLVGPSRGSSAGSLVCYLLGITEVDPIEFGLLFERFIDINRNDLPDIDIDFPDDKRESVIKELIKTYGEENVCRLANISTMQPKVSIVEFAKALSIPEFEISAIKKGMIERPEGDSRSDFCIADTFETTEAGIKFVNDFPEMKSVQRIEGHPRHSSVHAAGIIICTDEITNFVGVNSRDGTAMVDKKEAEYLNLLKIDVLGLRTLSVLAECAEMVGMKHTDYYSLPLDDEKTFTVFNEMRINGIFQFEGYALMGLTKKMGVHEFNDLVAITSLARPSVLQSGGAARYIKYKLGEDFPKYINQMHMDIVGETFGIVIYQEQLLKLCRVIGRMSWEDVNYLRKALSKSLGEEAFSKHKDKFILGAIENGCNEEESLFLWGEVCFGGSYGFNKSHAVSYALISYWCAYMKVRHPKEFTVANLNNAKDDESALRLLRDAVTHDGLKYIAIDPDESQKKWSINSKGIIVGSLLNIKGIGPAGANKIISARETGEELPPSIIMHLLYPKTIFDVLYPCDFYWGDIYNNPSSYGLTAPPTKIADVQDKGKYLVIGRLMSKEIKDLNEYEKLKKRGGKVFDSETIELAVEFEDDTDRIRGSIGRFDYDRIGKEIAENGIEEEDWFLIKGEIKYQSRYFSIQEIMKLKKEMVEPNGN